MPYNVIDPNSGLFNRFSSDEININLDTNEKRINEMVNPVFQDGIEPINDITFISDNNYNTSNLSFSWGNKHCLRLTINQAIMPPSKTETLLWIRNTNSDSEITYYHDYSYGFGTTYRYYTIYTKSQSESVQPATKVLERTMNFPAIFTLGYITKSPLTTMRFMGIDPVTNYPYLFILNQGTGIIQALGPIPKGTILNFDFL